MQRANKPLRRILGSEALCALLGCLLLAWPSTSLAQTEPSVADKETARALYAQGNDSFARGDYRAALSAFAGADGIMRVPTTALGLGKAELQIGHLLEARDSLLRAARHPVAQGEPASFTEARQQAALLAEELVARIPTLELRVHAHGAPAIAIDGVTVPPARASYPQRLNPGKHRVEVTAPDQEPLVQVIDLAEGERRVLEMTLEGKRAAPRRTEPTPKSTPKPAPLPAEPMVAMSPLAWAGFGVTAVGLVVGTATGIVSLGAAADVEAACDADKTCPASAQSDIDRSLVTAHVATASFVVAGAGAVVGIVGLFVDLGDREENALRPLVGPGAVGIEGTF